MSKSFTTRCSEGNGSAALTASWAARSRCASLVASVSQKVPRRTFRSNACAGCPSRTRRSRNIHHPPARTRKRPPYPFPCDGTAPSCAGRRRASSHRRAPGRGHGWSNRRSRSSRPRSHTPSSYGSFPDCRRRLLVTANAVCR